MDAYRNEYFRPEAVFVRRQLSSAPYPRATAAGWNETLVLQQNLIV